MNVYVLNNLLPSDITKTINDWLIQLTIADRKSNGWRDIYNELKLKRTIGGPAAATLIRQNINVEIIELLEVYSL
tara:strand:+ start:266 stop:490 length:225 start_codon:yes stop_codon:yes gene_type:complete